jgi:GPH family glycoside/pentoside/hexuronide:cation symporter
MTGDSEERGNLQTWRFAMAMLGGFLVTFSIFKLAALIGGGEEPENYQFGFPIAAAILAAVAVVCFLLCFKLTKEYVYAEQKEKRRWFQDLAAMFSNSQWWVLALATLIIMTRGAMQGGTKAYFVDYYLITDNLPGWLVFFMGTTSSRLSWFLSLTMLAGVGGAVTANFLIRKYCKVTVMQMALGGTIIMNGLLFVIARDAVLTALILTMLSNFCHMMFVPLLFSAIPDTVNFGLRMKGVGAMAMFCAGHLFVLKMGNAFGGWLNGHMLDWFGYVPNVEQSERALTGILLAFAGSSVVAAILVIICLQFYRLRRGWETRPEFTSAQSVL